MLNFLKLKENKLKVPKHGIAHSWDFSFLSRRRVSAWAEFCRWIWYHRPEGTLRTNQQLWEHRKQPHAAASWARRGRKCHAATCPPAACLPDKNTEAPAGEHTDFSWKTGDLVFGQIQNSHRLKQLDIGRNDLNQGITDMPFFQVCLLLQRIWELLKQNEWHQSLLGPQGVGAERRHAQSQQVQPGIYVKGKKRESMGESIHSLTLARSTAPPRSPFKTLGLSLILQERIGPISNSLWIPDIKIKRPVSTDNLAHTHSHDIHQWFTTHWFNIFWKQNLSMHWILKFVLRFPP